MEKIDLDLVLKEFKNLDIPNNEIIQWVPNLLHEIESLRSENEKLRKVAEASEDYLLNHESSETCFSCDGDMTHYDKVELALKEWKGE